MHVSIDLSTLAAFVALAIAMAGYIKVLRSDLGAERARTAAARIPLAPDDVRLPPGGDSASSSGLRVSGKRPPNLYAGVRQANEAPGQIRSQPGELVDEVPNVDISNGPSTSHVPSTSNVPSTSHVPSTSNVPSKSTSNPSAASTSTATTVHGPRQSSPSLPFRSSTLPLQPLPFHSPAAGPLLSDRLAKPPLQPILFHSPVISSSRATTPVAPAIMQRGSIPRELTHPPAKDASVNGSGKGKMKQEESVGLSDLSAPPRIRGFSTLLSVSSVPSAASSRTVARTDSTMELQVDSTSVSRGQTPSGVTSTPKKSTKSITWSGSESSMILQGPPDDLDPPPALGDVYRHVVFDHPHPRYQLWVRVAADGCHTWLPVIPGYQREDGRRLILTAMKKDPSWVQESHFLSVMRAERKVSSEHSVSAPPHVTGGRGRA
ncbi:hypothetical protein C8Q80DRAFT_1122903 [Daedaleopsis nitida]|nr:hypothetical protein C8Q80DRAFT_1122903 [Daedaleopsis nitida]